jgi:hypothetical protein
MINNKINHNLKKEKNRQGGAEFNPSVIAHNLPPCPVIIKEGFVMKIKLLWREKEARQSFYSAILISLMLCLFWVFLFVGICAEQDRREGQQKSNRKWAQERAVNQYETEQVMKVTPRQETELTKAMRMVEK